MTYHRRMHRYQEAIELATVHFAAKTKPYMVDDYWACIPWDSARHPWLTYREGIYKPAPHYCQWAKDLCRVLNAQVGHDGVWSVAWTDFTPPPAFTIVPRRASMIFFDIDGDTKLVLDIEDQWPVACLPSSLFQYVNDAELAHAELRETDKQLEIRPADQIRWTRGERSANPNVVPDVLPFGLD